MVFITTASEEEAAKLGRAVVEEGLAACVNIVPRIRSIFRWQGQVSEEAETLMVVKTRAGLFDALAARAKALHSYDVPEVIAVPIAQGSPAYLSWIREVTRNPQG